MSVKLSGDYKLELGTVSHDEDLLKAYDLARHFKNRPEPFSKFKQLYDRAYKKGEHIYFAQVDGVYVGTISVRYYPSPPFGMAAYVGAMIIEPAFRGTNIVDELFSFVEKNFRAKNIKISTFGRHRDSPSIERYAYKYGYRTKFIAYTKDRPENFTPKDVQIKMHIAEKEPEFKKLFPLLRKMNHHLHDTAESRQIFRQARDWGYKLHYLKNVLNKPQAFVGIRTFVNPYWAVEGIINGFVFGDTTHKNYEENVAQMADYAEKCIWSDAEVQFLHVLGRPENHLLRRVLEDRGFDDSYMFYLRHHDNV